MCTCLQCPQLPELGLFLLCEHFYLFISHFFSFYFIFWLYNIILVLPYIKMNPPQVVYLVDHMDLLCSLYSWWKVFWSSSLTREPTSLLRLCRAAVQIFCMVLTPFRLSQISCFTLQDPICLLSVPNYYFNVGISPLLQFLYPPGTGPVLLSLLLFSPPHFPFLPLLYQVLCGSIFLSGGQGLLPAFS